MKKVKLHKRLTKKLSRVIHPNRHFIWAVILLVISGAALSSYIYIISQQEDANAVFSFLKTSNVYISKAQGYVAFYPNSWQLEKDQSGNIIFENPLDLTESISVTTAGLDMEAIIRRAITVRQETDFTRGTEIIALISAGSAKDGSNLDLAIIKTPDKLYYISGHSAIFRAFVLNLKIF